MKTKFVFITVILFTFLHINAQEVTLVLGKKHIIKSTILNKEREVKVYVPNSYNSNTQSYPVLYILNGERWFFHGVNLGKTFSDLNLAPEFIVVAVNVNSIENPRERYAFFTQNTQNLADFLEKELLPLIDNNYRTTKERILFGWEYAGGFVVENAFKKPSLFDAFFAASPFPAAGQRLTLINQQISGNTDLDGFLYFTSSINEGQVKDQADQLAEALKQKAPKSLVWKYNVIEDETSTGIGHLTTPFKTLYEGLRNYYFDYGRLEFLNVEGFNAAGGLDYVKKYYSDRAERYQLTNEIPLEGMFALVRMALQENNFSVFDTLMKDFIERGFVEKVSPRNAIGYAQFYLRNNDVEAGKSIYERLIQKYPNEPTPANGLGHVYNALKEKKKAIRWYQKAVDLAKKGKHPRLSQFENDLKKIK